jgi:porin
MELRLLQQHELARRSPAIALVLLAVLAAWLPWSTARGQHVASLEPYGLCTTPQLTGDWFGARSSLAESGITFLSDSTNFYFGNTAGGVTRDFDFAGHNDYVMLVDGAKRWGRDGFSVKLKAEHRYGETLDNDIGAFFSPTILADLPKFDSERLYLTNVLFTQALSEDLVVFAGKMDTLDGDMNAFAHGRGKTQFSNLAFVFNPIVADTVPYSTLGAGFVVLREGQPVLGLTVLNSNDTTGTSGFEQLFNDGVLLSAYLRLPTQFFDRPGHQLFGGTWNNRLYNSLGDAYIDYPDLVIPTTRASWSLFWNFDQYLVYDDETGRGWGPFGRAGIADDNTNPLAWFLSFGLGGDSPIASRPADRFGIGWYYASTSSQIGPVLEAAFGQIGNGQGFECFYNYQLTPAIYLTPDLQVIVPAREEIDAALVIGLRAQMIF